MTALLVIAEPSMRSKSSASAPTVRLALAEAELVQLRKQISELTIAILRDVGRRQELARKVARIKEESGLAIENLAVEEKLKTTIEEDAKKIGLDRTLALQIVNLLIDYSKSEQRRAMFSRRIIDFLDRNKIKSVTIIGAGRMGGWFARYFKSVNRDIFLYDRRRIFGRRIAGELACNYVKKYLSIFDSDLIIVAVPISQTTAEIKKIQESINKKPHRVKAIFEISSVKGRVLQWALENDSTLPVVSIHPLFGPSANDFAQNTVAIVNRRDRAPKYSSISLQFVKGIFPQYNIVQVEATAHDREMALKLSLPHALALVFAKVLSRNRSIKRDIKLDTASFGVMKEISRKVLSENPDVYFEIQTSNKFTLSVLKDLESAIEEFKEIVELEDRSRFKKLFAQSEKAI